MKRTPETRSVDKEPVKLSEGEEGNTAVGYGSVFHSVTEIAGMFTEEIAPTAFNKTIKEANVRATFNHDFNNLLGTTKAGSVKLALDEKGLLYNINLPNTSLGHDVRELLSRGDLDGSSWMGYVIQHEWENADSEMPHRTITEVALLELGPVAMPAYEDATAALRSLKDLQMDEALNSLQEKRDQLARDRKKYFSLYRF